jgi:hypothetical protein
MKKFTYTITETDVTTVNVADIKKNAVLALIKPSLKGPVNKPIVFNSITEGMKYFKNYNNGKEKDKL